MVAAISSASPVFEREFDASNEFARTQSGQVLARKVVTIALATHVSRLRGECETTAGCSRAILLEQFSAARNGLARRDRKPNSEVSVGFPMTCR
jgi:hypothetical protein